MPKIFVCLKFENVKKWTYSREKHAKKVFLNIPNVESEHQDKTFSFST